MIPRKVCLIGLGLIGGSIGLGLVQSRKIANVSGWDTSPEARLEAERRRAVHAAPAEIAAAVDDADLVIIATPIRQVLPTLEKILPYLKPQVVVTDVASIKEEITKAVVQVLPQGMEYIGGHPMAGTEGSGIAAADPYLFENAVYILTPTERSGERAVSMMTDVLAIIGAHPLTISPRDHDRMVAAVSHLPHIAAVGVANVAGAIENIRPGTLSLAAGGFRDATRIAMSPPELWGEIVFSNRVFVLEMLERLKEELTVLGRLIREGREEAFRQRFHSAGEIRRQVPQKNKGFLRLLHELVVQVQDRPGAIAGVVNLLADNEINIKDIEILRVREGEGGTLRLAVEDAESLDLAIRILRENGYQVHPR